MDTSSQTLSSFMESLKVGDLVYVRSDYYLYKRLVAKLTATQIVLDSGDRFRRDNGRSVAKASKWASQSLLYPPSPALEVEYQRTQDLRTISSVDNWKTLDNHKLSAIASILRDDKTFIALILINPHVAAEVRLCLIKAEDKEEAQFMTENIYAESIGASNEFSVQIFDPAEITGNMQEIAVNFVG